MENIVIKLVVEGNAKEATNQLDKLSDKEKEVKKNFDEIAKSSKKAGDSVKKAGREAESSFDKLNDSLAGIGATIAGAFAVEAIVAFGKESVKAFAEAEETSRKLEFAVKNIANGSDGALDMLLKQAAELKAVSIFDDDDIIAAQEAMITYGLTTDQVAKLTPKIVDLASATGTDLASATDKVVSAINGQTRGLKSVGLQFKDTGDKVENYNTILEKLNKFQGAAADATTSTMGALKRFDVFMGDLKENTGEVLRGMADAFVFMWDSITGGAEESRKAITLTTAEVEKMGQAMVKLGMVNDLVTASDETLKAAREANVKQLEEITEKYKLADVNITATVGKMVNDRIVAIDKEIQRRKDLKNEVMAVTDETEKQKGAYDRLTESINLLNKALLDQLAADKEVTKTDVKKLLKLEERKKEIEDYLKWLRRRIEAEKNPINELMQGGANVQTYEGFNNLKLEKDKAYEKEKLDLAKTNMDATAKYNEQKLKEADERFKKYDEEQKKAIEERNAIVAESLVLTTQLTNQFFDYQMSLISQERDARLKVIEEEKNAKINQAGITAKKRTEYEQQFERDKQALLEETFEKEKKYKKQQAIINGALAITNILATTPDPTGTLTAIRIAGAVATTAAQVALIDAQKFEKGGWIGGKRHREGGTLIEAEKDEFVVNRRDAQANKGLLESLNKGMTEKYIYDKYVLPAILNKSINQVNQQGLADNIANSLKYQMYDDVYLRKTFKQATMQSAQYIVSGLKSTQKPSRYV